MLFLTFFCIVILYDNIYIRQYSREQFKEAQLILLRMADATDRTRQEYRLPYRSRVMADFGLEQVIASHEAY